MQGEVAAKKAVLDSVAGHLNGILDAAKQGSRDAGVTPPRDAAQQRADLRKLAGPLQVIFTQLAAAQEVFDLGIRVRNSFGAMVGCLQCSVNTSLTCTCGCAIASLLVWGACASMASDAINVL